MQMIGELSKLLGVSDTTVYDWIRKYKDFFTPGAKGDFGKKRQFTEGDILILATIAKLYNDGLSHKGIQEKLMEGYRVENPGEANFGVDTRMIPVAAVEQIIDATEVKSSLESIRVERDRLLVELQKVTEKFDAQVQEIKDLSYKLGLAEGELKYLRRLMEKDE